MAYPVPVNCDLSSHYTFRIFPKALFFMLFEVWLFIILKCGLAISYTRKNSSASVPLFSLDWLLSVCLYR